MLAHLAIFPCRAMFYSYSTKWCIPPPPPNNVVP